MCSIGEDDFGDDGGVHAMVPNKVESTDEKGKCKKCLAEGVTVYKLYFRDFECKECFLNNARHKFRATLGSSKILPRDAHVLLVFDGSDDSMVLLDMLYYAQTQSSFKRLHCTVKVIYIDESMLQVNELNDGSENDLLHLQKHLQSYNAFNYYFTSIACNKKPQIFELNEIKAYLQRCRKNEYDFIQKLKSIRSWTSRQDFLKYQKNLLIATIANQLDCPYIFLPDISTTLATQLLTAITLGRGGSAAFDVALVDERFGKNVKIIRPLRDLNQPEIDLYIRVRNLNPFKTKKDTYGSSSGPAASLQNLTRSFVENLQGNYSSTVSTVFRCCDKIAPKYLHQEMSSLSISSTDSENFKKITASLNVCSFCGSPIDANNSETLLAIEFSRLVSEKGATSDDISNLDIEARKNLTQSIGVDTLCHGCENIAFDDTNGFLRIKS